jgi:hypothetical protein
MTGKTSSSIERRATLILAAHALKSREEGAEHLLGTFNKTYRTACWTAWGTETILATAGTRFVLNTKSI